MADTAVVEPTAAAADDATAAGAAGAGGGAGGDAGATAGAAAAATTTTASTADGDDTSTTAGGRKQLYKGADPAIYKELEEDTNLGGMLNVGKDPPHPSMLRHILSSLRPGQDLTRVTIPSFFLEKRSLLEKLGDSFMHPELALEIPKIDDPVGRMVQLVKFWLSGWHYKTVGVKKPYNPVVGETFACAWDHKDGTRSQYFAEQVSHRPPMSATYFENREAGIVINCEVWTKSKFRAPQTAISAMIGGADVHLINRDERYRVTLPTFYANGLLFGTLRMEIGDTSTIICEKTGLMAELNFHQKPYFGGTYNQVTGKIFTIKDKGVLYEINGKWNEEFKIKEAKKKKSKLFFDTRKLAVTPKRVLPIDKQGIWESRRLWRYVTSELEKRPIVTWTEVDRYKLQLEDAQRLLPCHNDPYPKWKTKKFKLKEVYNPLSGKKEQMHVFEDMRTEPYKKGEPELNVIHLSSTLPDERGKTGSAEEATHPAAS